jgi:hypothetical protein
MSNKLIQSGFVPGGGKDGPAFIGGILGLDRVSAMTFRVLIVQKRLNHVVNFFL